MGSGDDASRQALASIIATHVVNEKSELLASPLHVERSLFVSGHANDSDIILASRSVEIGAVWLLSRQSSQESSFVAYLTDRLVKEFGYGSDDAAWAIKTWSEALKPLRNVSLPPIVEPSGLYRVLRARWTQLAAAAAVLLVATSAFLIPSLIADRVPTDLLPESNAETSSAGAIDSTPLEPVLTPPPAPKRKDPIRSDAVGQASANSTSPPVLVAVGMAPRMPLGGDSVNRTPVRFESGITDQQDSQWTVPIPGDDQTESFDTSSAVLGFVQPDSPVVSPYAGDVRGFGSSDGSGQSPDGAIPPEQVESSAPAVPDRKAEMIFDGGDAKYSTIAKSTHASGRVVVRLQIASDGTPVKAEIVAEGTTAPVSLHSTATDKAMKSRWKPATKNGVDVADTVIVPFDIKPW